ncbi:hypothetical protein OG762_27910 [Streptomyces sp. NBC_01136]|uniref:hypothetical protein n=1 Tax=unclassified Streptomyces TaxID=2593676 RepID=UPI003244434F|nr:hypothetical protein OG762_27910 [Streptomyces sp. NBC_01136]
MSTPEPMSPESPEPTLAGDPEQPRYEPPPSVGKLMIWVLVFFVAALAVVLGGVYLT